MKTFVPLFILRRSAVRICRRLPAFALRATARQASLRGSGATYVLRAGRRLSRRSSKSVGGLFAIETSPSRSQQESAQMDAPTGHDQNADQIAYWNGPAGQRWAQRQAAQDVVLGPVADLVIDRAKLKPGERVIDVGCGSGATAVAFARSEEHTSELQSPCNLVCRLLLEKKKNNNYHSILIKKKKKKKTI